MELDVLRSTLHANKWRDSHGTATLCFEVVPKDGQYLEIGNAYVFTASRYAATKAKERQLVKGFVSFGTETEALANIEATFEEADRPICGWASFSRELLDDFETAPPTVFFTVIVEQQIFEKMLRTIDVAPGAATISLSIEGLKYGWEPDASHLIWEYFEGKMTRPISMFSYNAERFWTSETAIGLEADRRMQAELTDSPDLNDKKLAASMASRKEAVDPLVVLLKGCRALLIAILLVEMMAFFR